MATHVKVTDVRPRAQDTGDGVSTTFEYPFAIFNDADIEVYFGAEKQESGFSVFGAGSSSGGAVMFDVPPAAGTVVTLRRHVPLERVGDAEKAGEDVAHAINEELDHQVAALQEIACEVSRAVRLSPTSSDARLVLPAATERANRLLGFDTNGDLALREPATGSTSTGTGSGAVDSVFGRTGVVSAQAGDYAAAQVANVPAGNVKGETVQAAIDELDRNKEPAFAKNAAFNKDFGGNGSATTVARSDHTHALGELSDVAKTGAQDGDALVWSQAAGQWEPQAFSATKENPQGSEGQIQYRTGTSLGGVPQLVYDESKDHLLIGSAVYREMPPVADPDLQASGVIVLPDGAVGRRCRYTFAIKPANTPTFQPPTTVPAEGYGSGLLVEVHNGGIADGLDYAIAGADLDGAPLDMTLANGDVAYLFFEYCYGEWHYTGRTSGHEIVVEGSSGDLIRIADDGSLQSAGVAATNLVKTDPDASGAVGTLVAMDQASYDQLATPSPDTLYVIVA